MRGSRLMLFSWLVFSFILFGLIVTKRSKDELLKIAKEYKTYKQYVYARIVVSDSTKYKWTITLCAKPSKEFDMGFHYKRDSLLLSEARGTAMHGNKLYKLFVKDYDSYISNSEYGQPVGQVIVKETWNVTEVRYDSTSKSQFKNWNDNKWYVPTTVSELYIMYKEEGSSTNDRGWTYGIVDLENGQEYPAVLYAGNLSNCISCHKGTKYDRIFGIQKAPTIK